MLYPRPMASATLENANRQAAIHAFLVTNAFHNGIVGCRNFRNGSPLRNPSIYALLILSGLVCCKIFLFFFFLNARFSFTQASQTKKRFRFVKKWDISKRIYPLFLFPLFSHSFSHPSRKFFFILIVGRLNWGMREKFCNLSKCGVREILEDHFSWLASLQ